MSANIKKSTIRFLSTLFFIIALLNVYMFIMQPGMVFFPYKSLQQTPDQWGLEYEDVFVKSGNQNRIHGWYLPAQGSNQSLLFFHGNGGNISHRGDSLKIFNRLGLNVLIIDYQGYGKSEGSPGEKKIYQDAQAAWTYLLEEKNFKPSEIVIFGRSLGGVVAARLASEVTPRALIIESTFSSVNDMAKRIFPVLSKIIYSRYKFDALESIKKNKAPLLLLHSRDDEIIPFELGEKIYQQASKPKIFVEMAGDHNNGFILSQPGYEQALKNFLSAQYPGLNH